jgi:hypothetical protein
MPHYAAALKGEKNVLEDIAPCFNTALSTIRRRDDEWIMESSNFEQCQSVEEAYTVANALLRQINQVLYLYLRLVSPFSISSIMVFDGYILVRRRMWAIIDFNAYGSAIKTLSPTASGSLATDVLSLAASDPAVREALSLCGHEALTWSRIYDIIEFLGGPSLIAESGRSSKKKKTTRVKQTANHYRHLGNPQNYKLPSNPPTLRAASLFAFDILQKWIAQKT